MKTKATSKIGWEILKLLGIDIHNVFEADIHLNVKEPMTIDVKSFVRIDEEFVLNKAKTEIETELKKYRLEEIK